MSVKEKFLDLVREVAGKTRTGEVTSKIDDMMDKLPSHLAYMVGGGLTSISEFLQIEDDLRSRFMDYEDMADLPELNSALDIYSDDSTQSNTMTNKSVWVEGENQGIIDDLEEMLHKRINIDEELWGLARNLNMYGGDFEELLVKEGEGVVGLNFLPTPLVRAVVDKTWKVIGYKYHPQGKFTQTTEEDFKAMIEGKKLSAIGEVLFEDWNVAHFKLGSRKRYDIYGSSVLEAARWIWRRLILLEDSMLIYRLCLRGDSKIWTTSGYKTIKNILPGDEVYSYTQNGELQKTKVVYQKHNGKDDLYRVWSKHREIHANKTHPVLVETWTKPGSGRGHSSMRILKYVEVQNLIPGEHRFLMPVKPRPDGEDILLKLPEISYRAKIQKGKANLLERTMTYPDIAKKCGVHHYRARDFLAGKYELPLATATKVVEMNGGNIDVLESRQDWGGIKRINIPEYVTENFAQWFGFMLGDGFLCERHHKGGYVADNGVGFALGDDKPTNQCYRKLFEDIVGPVTLGGDSGGRLGFYGIYSKKFVEFMKLNGFIPGAHNKRVPEWVFRAKSEIQLAFLNGLIDADGCRRDDRVDLKMCNRELLEDVRVLCMQLGITVGKKVGTGISESHKLPGGRTIKGGVFYTLYLAFEPEEPSEFILGVEPAGNDDIYDIGVESELHNFVADGVVVHNTRAAARFIFYIDVGDRPPQEAYNYITKVKTDFKKKKFVNRAGHLDMRYNPLSSDEDLFIGTRNGKRSAEVETLQGPIYGAIDDVEYFKDKLYAAIKIPKAYLGFESDISAKALLSQEDIRFSRTILRIQRELRNGIKQICKVHMAARGIDPLDIEYDVMMTVPSAIFEQSYLEVLKSRAEVADKLQAFISVPWILKNIFHFSEAEIMEMEQMKVKADQTSGPTMDLSSVPAGAGIEVNVPEGSDINQQILLAIKNSGVSPKAFLSDRISLELAQQKLDKSLGLIHGKGNDNDKLVAKVDNMMKGQGALSGRLKELSSLLGELRHSMPKHKG